MLLKCVFPPSYIQQSVSVSGLDHTLPTNTVYARLTYGHPGVGNRRENKNGSVECRRICEIKSSEYMSWYATLYTQTVGAQTSAQTMFTCVRHKREYKYAMTWSRGCDHRPDYK
jgi:hypothetical protein